MRINEVERLGEATPFSVSDRVGPGGNLGQVIGVVVPQELFEMCLGGVGNEMTSKVGCGDVSKALMKVQVSAKANPQKQLSTCQHARHVREGGGAVEHTSPCQGARQGSKAQGHSTQRHLHAFGWFVGSTKRV